MKQTSLYLSEAQIAWLKERGYETTGAGVLSALKFADNSFPYEADKSGRPKVDNSALVELVIQNGWQHKKANFVWRQLRLLGHKIGIVRADEIMQEVRKSLS